MTSELTRRMVTKVSKTGLSYLALLRAVTAGCVSMTYGASAIIPTPTVAPEELSQDEIAIITI